jgi:hypothetical protein
VNKTAQLDRIDAMLRRANDAYNDYRRWLDKLHAEQAKAIARTALTMIANFDHNDGTLTDHEHERRLVFIMSANIQALNEELRK